MAAPRPLVSEYLATHCGKIPAVMITLLGVGLIVSSSIGIAMFRAPKEEPQDVKARQKEIIESHQWIHTAVLVCGVILVSIIWGPYLLSVFRNKKGKGASTETPTRVAAPNL